jgi:hypothetical protein
MPSMEEQYRLETWDSKKALESSCAWAPCCKKLAVECGGIWRKKYYTYGENGTKDLPTNEEFQTWRRELRGHSRKLTGEKRRSLTVRHQMMHNFDWKSYISISSN